MDQSKLTISDPFTFMLTQKGSDDATQIRSRKTVSFNPLKGFNFENWFFSRQRVTRPEDRTGIQEVTFKVNVV